MAKLFPKRGVTGWRPGVLLILFMAALALIPSSALAARFLSFSDLHFNPFADPALVQRLTTEEVGKWEAILNSSKAATLGKFGEDTPWPLFKATLDDMAKTVPAPDFIIFSGDFLAHNLGCNPSDAGKSQGCPRTVDKTMQFITEQIRSRFKGVPVIATLGNNDSATGDYTVEPGGAFLRNSSLLFKELVVDSRSAVSVQTTFPLAGYYEIQHPTLKDRNIIVLNANLLSNDRRANATGAGNVELAWLRSTLARNRTEQKKVWLLFHEPMGVDVHRSRQAACPNVATLIMKKNLNEALVALLKEFAPIIDVSFAGHTHMDEFRLIRDQGKPVVATLIIPAVSPVFGNNPAYRVFTYEHNGTITDSVTRVLQNLTTAESPKNAVWVDEYRFSTVYGVGSYAPADLGTVLTSIRSDAKVRANYERFFKTGRPDDDVANSWQRYWCGIGNVIEADYNACVCTQGVSAAPTGKENPQ